MHIVICGGGVIGASIAYFLARRGIAATVVERAALANAASGKSGGFLALDWCDGTPLQSLARRSFALHAKLAEESGIDWGFRRLDTYGGYAGAGGRRVHRPDWLAEDVVLNQKLGGRETTAQVHPEEFTAALMRMAEAKGASLRHGTVTGVVRAPFSHPKSGLPDFGNDGAQIGQARSEREKVPAQRADEGLPSLTSSASNPSPDRSATALSLRERVTGVVVDHETIPADAVVIAMGPWSVLAAEWLPLPAVYGLKGHSIVFETGDRTPAEALFLEVEDGQGALAPEIFPRPDGTTWCCAVSSDSPLPADPASVEPDPGAMERLEALCRKLSPALADAPILARQACFRPVTRDGLPLIGAVPGVQSAYVATGHSVWGILSAPATGEAMAELILDGEARSADLSLFSPSRLRPLQGRQSRTLA